MSTNTTREVVPTTKTLEKHKTTCDICKVVSIPTSGPEIDWKANLFAFDKIQISRTTGDSYPEGGNSETVAFHVCPSCWAATLVPMLEGLGAEPTVTECDW